MSKAVIAFPIPLAISKIIDPTLVSISIIGLNPPSVMAVIVFLKILLAD